MGKRKLNNIQNTIIILSEYEELDETFDNVLCDVEEKYTFKIENEKQSIYGWLLIVKGLENKITREPLYLSDVLLYDCMVIEYKNDINYFCISKEKNVIVEDIQIDTNTRDLFASVIRKDCSTGDYRKVYKWFKDGLGFKEKELLSFFKELNKLGVCDYLYA